MSTVGLFNRGSSPGKNGNKAPSAAAAWGSVEPSQGHGFGVSQPVGSLRVWEERRAAGMGSMMS